MNDLAMGLGLLSVVANHAATAQETKERVDHLQAEVEKKFTPEKLEAFLPQASRMTYDDALGML